MKSILPCPAPIEIASPISMPIPVAACSSSTISSSAAASLPEQHSWSGIQTLSTRPSSMPCQMAGTSLSSPSSAWNIRPSKITLGSHDTKGKSRSGQFCAISTHSESAVSPSQVAAVFSTQASARLVPSPSSA